MPYPPYPPYPFPPYEPPPPRRHWGRIFVRLVAGVAALSIFVLMSRIDGESIAPPKTWKELQHAIDTIGLPLSGEEEGKEAAVSSAAQRLEAVRSAEDVEPRMRSSASSALSRRPAIVAPKTPTEAPKRTQVLVRTVRWAWPVPVVPPEGQAIVGRILFRGSCTGPLTITRIRLAYSGSNPFLIGGVGLIDTSEGEPRTELTPMTVGMQRGKGDIDLALEPPVVLGPCERDPAVILEDREDLRSMDIVVSAHVDTNEWSVHQISFGPDEVTADGPLVWDEGVDPVEGTFQFFTGKDAKRKSQEGLDGD